MGRAWARKKRLAGALWLEVGGAVEAVGAYPALGQSYGFYEGFEGVEFEGCEAEALANFLYQGFILRRACA